MAYKSGVLLTTYDTWDDLSRTVVVWGHRIRIWHRYLHEFC